MMNNISPKRVIFIDMMRAFAVLMMVQGHTIDTFLSNEYRTTESILYNIWFTIRGFTAPIFMFSSGTVFTYLLRLHK
ncbi:MAG: heparan-alpha-glucosaminide N-acetyltransferase domain-containing protein, partial [Melioribacter sp.]|nr:heparan-alpha-glucosaminide N-acetyltransferase domain-containing protein [Melioribacter sp.]